MRLGDRVRLSKESSWYEDIGDSIGTLVAMHNEEDNDCVVIFTYEDFVNGDYNFKKLHKCEIRKNIYEVDMEYFEEDWFDDNYLVLISGHKGYKLEGKCLIQVKKGNISIFNRR